MKVNLVAGLLAAAFFSLTAYAQVHRSDSGLGGALILPYWTVSKGNDTLLSVRNESDQASALKLRFLDEEGALLEVFNLYLDARTLWGVAVTQLGGQSMLLPTDVGCMLPAPSLSHGGIPALSLGAPRGSLEIIEMGVAGDEQQDLVSNGRWLGCAALADAFAAGTWSEDANAGMQPPAQSISGTARLINVGVSGMSSVPATAIGGFSDIAQHTDPESALPDLANAFDLGSDHGGVRSRVCVASGCRIDEWERSIEAVAAVLMVSRQTVQYAIDPDLGAEFEWLMHRPLKRYEAEIEGFAIGSLPEMEVRSSQGVARPVNPRPCIIPNAECLITRSTIPGGAIFQSLPFNTVFGPGGAILESSLLGHPAVIHPVYALSGAWLFDAALKSGTAIVEFDSGNALPLTATDGTRFLGEPLISFALQQFSNGTLVDAEGQKHSGQLPTHRTTPREPSSTTAGVAWKEAPRSLEHRNSSAFWARFTRRPPSV